MKQKFIVFVVLLLSMQAFASVSSNKTDSSVESIFANSKNKEELGFISYDQYVAQEEAKERAEAKAKAEALAKLTHLDYWNTQVNADLSQLFEVLILVNKAASGTSAQKAKVFYKGNLLKTYTVSTGRETYEYPPSGAEYYSSTPVGFFSPEYLDRYHTSITWEAPMPFAVFFNDGIAIHATVPSHYDELGQRASGGCVRMTYDDAQEVYNLVQSAGFGLVPKFARSGSLERNAQGQLEMQNNYKTLIIVEDFQD